MKNFLSLWVCLLAGSAVAGGAPAKSGAGTKWLQELNAGLKPYRPQSGGLEFSVTKRTSNPLLLKEKRSEGKLTFAPQNLRLEISKPEASLFIVSKDTAWLVRDGEAGKPPVINRVRRASLAKSNSVFALIFANEPLGKHFRIRSRKAEGEDVNFSLTPKDLKSTDVVELTLVFSKDMKTLKQIKYVDDRENLTVFELTDMKNLKTVAEGTFSYVPPKGAEVVDL